MTDIVDRLRENAWVVDRMGQHRIADEMRDAATEIERLREYLRNIQMVPRSDAAHGVIQCLTRAALKEGER